MVAISSAITNSINIMSLDIDIIIYIYERHFPVAEQRHEFWSAAFSPLILKSTVFFHHSTIQYDNLTIFLPVYTTGLTKIIIVFILHF